jgi:hypothetical protein
LYPPRDVARASRDVAHALLRAAFTNRVNALRSLREIETRALR